MNRRLVLVRAAAIGVWIAAITNLATQLASRTTELSNAFQVDASSGIMEITVTVLELAALLSLTGSLGVVLWIGGDIYVKATEGRWVRGRTA